MPIGQQVAHAAQRCMKASSPEEYGTCLKHLQSLLPPSIQVREHDGRLHAYINARTQIPTAIAHYAHYIERRYPDGRAEVVKNHDGRIEPEPEPKERTFLDRLLGEDII